MPTTSHNIDCTDVEGLQPGGSIRHGTSARALYLYRCPAQFSTVIQYSRTVQLASEPRPTAAQTAAETCESYMIRNPSGHIPSPVMRLAPPPGTFHPL
eukprot:8627185-Pyramimonas_sp.AAC.1